MDNDTIDTLHTELLGTQDKTVDAFPQMFDNLNDRFTVLACDRTVLASRNIGNDPNIKIVVVLII
jgi:hypothetical protein